MKKLILMLLALNMSLFLMQGGAWAATYYVDASLGRDKNLGTSPSAAWKSIRKVNSFSFKPGDNVLFKRGQTWTGRLVIRASGTETMPITFADYDAGNKPKINGANINYAMIIDEASYITIRNLEIINTQGHGIVVWNGAVNGLVTIDSCDIHDNLKNGISVKDRGNVVVKNCRIYANRANGFSAYYSNDTGSWSDVICNNIQLLNNLVYNNGRAGVYLAGHNAVIQRNTFYTNGIVELNHNVYVIGDNSLVEKNIFKDAAKVGYRYEGSNMVFRYNYLEGNKKHNLSFWNDFPNVMTNNKVYYNIFLVRKVTGPTDLTSMAIFVGANSYSGIFDGIEIYNNSIYATDDDAGGIWLQNCDNIKVKNNIIDIGNGCLIYKDETKIKLQSDYNIFESPEIAPLYTGSIFAEFHDWQALGYDQHSHFALPHFVNSSPQTDADFMLAPDSCAIGDGVYLALNYDYRGTPVPGTPDIGALQHLN